MAEPEAASGARRETTRRWAVTLSLVFVYWALGWVPLPFLSAVRFHVLGATTGGTRFSARSLGVAPFLAAFLLVELYAALDPSLRRIRHGAAGRARLERIAWRLAIALAAAQAWGLAAGAWNRAELAARWGPTLMLEPVLAGGALEACGLVLTLVAATALVGILAQVVGRHGLGNGLAVLLVASLAGELPRALDAAHHGLRSADADPSLAALLVVFAGVPALVAGVLRWERVWAPRVPLPTTSLLPLGLYALPLAVEWVFSLGPHAPLRGAVLRAVLRVVPAVPDPRQAVLHVAILAGVGFAFARFSHRRATMIEAWRAVALPEPPAAAAVRQELLRSDLLSLGVLAALAALPFFVPFASHALLLGLAIATAVVLDVRSEARARRRLGPLVPAFSLQRVAAVEPVLAALGASGISALARARALRAVLGDLAPFAPIEILVPPARAEEAAAVCARIADPQEAPAPAPSAPDGATA